MEGSMEIGTAAAGAASAAKASGASAAALGAGAGMAAGLSMAVVMLWKKPRTEAEWITAIITTTVSSICGGAFAILHLGLLKWVDSSLPFVEQFVGAAALLGVAFACGLPGWAVIRWVFNWIAAREGKGIDEVVRDAKEIIG